MQLEHSSEGDVDRDAAYRQPRGPWGLNQGRRYLSPTWLVSRTWRFGEYHPVWFLFGVPCTPGTDLLCCLFSTGRLPNEDHDVP